MTKKQIDCLFIGHNEMRFDEYERTIRKMGTRSGSYRDLDMNFIRCNNIPMTAPDVFNYFCREPKENRHPPAVPFLTLGETFNSAIAYLGTYLHRRGYTFDFIQSFQEEKEKLAAKLKEGNILTVAIITTLYVSMFPILEIMAFIKECNTGTRVILGGPFIATHVRLHGHDSLILDQLFKTMDADFYVDSSQGESALVSILHSLKTGAGVDTIPNIYYKNRGSGGLIYTAAHRVRENNSLSQNMVDWGLFKGRVGSYAGVRTSISCPFSCAFCGFPQHAGEYQTADLDALETEFNTLHQTIIPDHLHFIDDTLNVPPERFKNILRMMIKNKYDFHWHSHFRCQFADRETIELMKESGCEGVFLGIESGCDTILENMNKAASVEQYLHGISLLKEYGITTFGCFIIGFPGETTETARESFDFIRNSGIDFYRAQLWYCDPITLVWKEKDKYAMTGAHFNWTHSTMNWEQACDLIEKNFLSTGEPVWVPQFNFEFDTVFHLLHRGLTLNEVKRFLNAFNNGVKEKLLHPDRSEVSVDILLEIKNYRENTASSSHEAKVIDHIDRSSVDFDF